MTSFVVVHEEDRIKNTGRWRLEQVNILYECLVSNITENGRSDMKRQLKTRTDLLNVCIYRSVLLYVNGTW